MCHGQSACCPCSVQSWCLTLILFFLNFPTFNFVSDHLSGLSRRWSAQFYYWQWPPCCHCAAGATTSQIPGQFYIEGGPEEARRVADKHGFVFMTEVCPYCMIFLTNNVIRILFRVLLCFCFGASCYIAYTNNARCIIFYHNKVIRFQRKCGN